MGPQRDMHLRGAGISGGGGIRPFSEGRSRAEQPMQAKAMTRPGTTPLSRERERKQRTPAVNSNGCRCILQLQARPSLSPCHAHAVEAELLKAAVVQMLCRPAPA